VLTLTSKLEVLSLALDGLLVEKQTGQGIDSATQILYLFKFLALPPFYFCSPLFQFFSAPGHFFLNYYYYIGIMHAACNIRLSKADADLPSMISSNKRYIYMFLLSQIMSSDVELLL
jgi:hypothetical protein